MSNSNAALSSSSASASSLSRPPDPSHTATATSPNRTQRSLSAFPHSSAASSSSSAPSPSPSTAATLASLPTSLTFSHSTPAVSSSPPELLSSAAARKRRRWARKHSYHQRFAHQSNEDPSWFRHSKHILICSWSGRPIYTRYGDESALAGYFGVICAIIENFQRINDDRIQVIGAGQVKVVFMLIGPIYLIAISRTGESVLDLRAQLLSAYSQIVSVLTGSVRTVLEQRPQYDIRNLMQGTESLLTDLITETDKNYCFLLDAIHCLRMPRLVRTRIGQSLRRGGVKNLLYGILLARSQLVHVVRGKDRILHPSDLLLLINFLVNSQSLRSSESWTPICLPKFSDRGFLYAYVCYLTEDICITLITADSSDFHVLRDAKMRMVEMMEKRNCLSEVVRCMKQPAIAMEELESGVAEYRHFIYRSEINSQMVIATHSIPFADRKGRKQLFRRYQSVHARMLASPKPAPPASSANAAHSSALVPVGFPPYKRYLLLFDVDDVAAVLGIYKPGEYELYCAFTPLVDKEAAYNAAQKTIKFIKREETTLFL